RLKRDLESAALRATGAMTIARKRSVLPLAIAAAAILTIVIGISAVIWWRVGREAVPRPELAERQLTQNPAENPVYAAAISPDGKQIAFVSGRTEAEIWAMQANGEQPRRIAEAGEGGRFLQLQWSPDGKRIAFMKSQGAEGKQQVTIESQAVESGERWLMLADPLLQSFCWTTDGHLLVSLQQPALSASDTNLWQLRVAADGRPH